MQVRWWLVCGLVAGMAVWRAWGEALLRLRLCPAVKGEEPPYPSCLE